jgi:hypothetical protein
VVKKILIATTTAVFLLTGCGSESGGGESSSPDNKTLKEQITALENEGKLPKLDRSADIAGPDGNANGIRDDIEAYIVQHYPDEQQKEALFQFAKTKQASLLVDTSNMIAVKETNRQDTRALICIIDTFDKQQDAEKSGIAWRKIRSMTTNTKPRLEAYLKFNHALDGTTWTLPEGDTCE